MNLSSIRSDSEQKNFKDASSFGTLTTRSCNIAVPDMSHMLYGRGLRNPVEVPASGRNTSIANLSDAPPSKHLLKDDKKEVLQNLEKAATMASKKQSEGGLSFAPSQEPSQDVSPAPPPPPQADTPFAPPSSLSTPGGKQQARRKMAKITHSPSNLRLRRASSMRSVNSSPHSSISKPSSVKDLSYAAGDELASFIHDDDYSSDDGSIMSELSEQTEEQGGVIAIGIITRPKDPRPAPPRRLSVQQITQEAISRVVATDIAQEEHEIKMQAKESASTPGRRLSVATLPSTKIGQSIAPVRQPRMSLQKDLQLSSTFLSALEESVEPSPVVQPPALRTRPSTDPSLTLQLGFELSSDGTTHLKAHARPSLRARRSGAGLSEMATTNQEEADRRVKVRAAMGAMGTSTHRVPVARTPPPMLSTPPSIGARNRKSLEEDNSLDSKRRKDENSSSEFTVTPRKPSSLARAFSSDSTVGGQSSFVSTDGKDSGIDLDPEVRDSIMRRASAHACGGLSGMATTNQEEADSRVKDRAAMVAMGTSTHRAPLARTPPPMLSTPPSIGVRNRKTVESLEKGNSLDKRRNEEVSSSEFSVTPRKPSSLARAFSSDSTRRGVQRQNSFVSTDSMDSGIDLDPEERDSIIRRASAHARGRRRGRRTSRISQMKSAASVASSNSYMSDDFSIDEAEGDDDPPMPFAAIDMKREPSQGRPSDEKAEYRHNPSAGLAMAMAPAAVAAAAATQRGSPQQSRPSDEKAAYRHNPSMAVPGVRHATAAQGGSPQQSRPSDEKAAYRHNPSMAVPGAHHVTSARREESRGLSLAPGICSRTELVHQDSLPFEPGSVTTRDMQLDEDERETQDLEAQAGVPVILPGAFAIDGLQSNESGYDSGFEENSVESGVARVMEESEDMPPPLDPITQTVPSAPLEAELYEQLEATAAVLSEIVEERSEGHKKHVRMLQGCSCILALTIILGIVLSVLLSGNGKAKNNGDGDSSVPTLEGWSQLGRDLLGPTDSDGSQFGYAVSLSGDGLRMAVGLPGRDHEDDKTLISVGAVMIMDFNGTDWLEIGVVDGPGKNAEAGKTLALSQDGSRLAVGAPSWLGGQVTIYQESELKIWEMVGEPLSGEDKEGGGFGASIAFSADAMILAVGDTIVDVGNVRVFKESNSTWTQLGDAMGGEITNALFGWSLDLSSDGTRVAASSLGTNGFSGSVRVFDFDGSSWIQNGPSIDGEADRERFGSSLSLSDDGSILAVGATGFTRGGSEIGVGRVQAFEFDEISKTWDQMGQSLEGVNRFDSFGSSVALSSAGDILAIGGPGNNLVGEKGGHVQVLEFDGTEWIQIGSDLGQFDPEKSGGQYGFSVALSSDGTRVAGGAPYFNFNGFLSKVGQVLVYEVDVDIDRE
jgi:hypothetical protein